MPNLINIDIAIRNIAKQEILEFDKRKNVEKRLGPQNTLTASIILLIFLFSFLTYKVQKLEKQLPKNYEVVFRVKKFPDGTVCYIPKGKKNCKFLLRRRGTNSQKKIY